MHREKNTIEVQNASRKPLLDKMPTLSREGLSLITVSLSSKSFSHSQGTPSIDVMSSIAHYNFKLVTARETIQN